MGLLDDAIREHLELKRLRGADPGEVAREQREALDPVPREEHSSEDQDSAAADAFAAEATGGTIPVDATPGGDHPPGAAQSAGRPGSSNGGEETAELDMRSVMHEDGAAPANNASPASSAATDPGTSLSAGEHPEEESLEWEVPGESTHQTATNRADHGHDLGEDDTGEAASGRLNAEQPAEELLAERPGLPRDTSEQERVSFEQRPPRDFGFDK